MWHFGALWTTFAAGFSFLFLGFELHDGHSLPSVLAIAVIGYGLYAAYAMFELDGGVIATLNSSWCVRVRRDDLVTFQVDGTHGSAVAGLQECRSQSRINTPKPIWNPDIPQSIDFYKGWQLVPDTTTYDNAFKAQWELFIRHVVEDAPYQWTLREGAKGVQLVELAKQSWKERRWIDVPELPA